MDPRYGCVCESEWVWMRSSFLHINQCRIPSIFFPASCVVLASSFTSCIPLFQWTGHLYMCDGLSNGDWKRWKIVFGMSFCDIMYSIYTYTSSDPKCISSGFAEYVLFIIQSTHPPNPSVIRPHHRTDGGSFCFSFIVKWLISWINCFV